MKLLLWGGLVTVVILLLRESHSGARASDGPSNDDSERILNERFVRGEIDETELNAPRRFEALNRFSRRSCSKSLSP